MKTSDFALVQNFINDLTRSDLDDDSKLDLLFDKVDDWLCEGKFSMVDLFLKRVPIYNLDCNLWIGILSITLAAKDQLTARQAFVYDVQIALSGTHTALEVYDLLRGLE